ncbi:MAG: response regulator [Chitinophagales bacterium]
MEDLIEIILVEDNPYDAMLTVRALKSKNFVNNVVHLNDGVEALDFIFGTGQYAGRNVTNRPRVIFLDLKMPRINGMEVLEKIKSNPDTKTIPVVILTSSAEDPDIKRCSELGANSYIVKPVEFENFSKVVADLGFYWVALNKA